MTRTLLITVLSIVLPLCALADLTGFGVITTKGWVSYAIGSDWKVASMQTKPPTTAAVFQIPNPADEGTGDFTNIAIMTFESDSQQAMASFNDVVGKIQSQSERTKYKESGPVRSTKQTRSDRLRASLCRSAGVGSFCADSTLLAASQTEYSRL